MMPTPTCSYSPRNGAGRHPGPSRGREALRAGVGPVWAAEGTVTLHLTLKVVEALDNGYEPQAQAISA